MVLSQIIAFSGVDDFLSVMFSLLSGALAIKCAMRICSGDNLSAII